MIRIVGAGKQQHYGECHRHLVIIVMVLLLLLMMLVLVLVLVLPVMVLVRMMPLPHAWRTALAEINSVVERQEFPVLPAPFGAARRRLRPIAFAV